MTSLADNDLLQRVRRGDRAAMGDFLQQHQGRLFNVILRMVSNREDAAELTQDVLLKVVQHIGEYRGQAELTTWMTRIAMNEAISHLRKRKLRQTVSLDGHGMGSSNGQWKDDDQATALRRHLADPREPGPDQRVENSERLGRLRQAIAELDEEFRAVIVLRDIQEMDYAQIAQALSLPVGTVKSRLFRARLALRERLVQLEGGVAERRSAPSA
jgi:RNA polymerase sigma-70 factor (ECF subfamily)